MNFNLELELSSKSVDKNGGDPAEEGSGESPGNSREQPAPSSAGQKMNVLYDVTELQARAILVLAGNEAELRMCKDRGKHGGARPRLMVPESEIQQRLCGGSAMTGLSMKASLQRFLQKRKVRAQARCPY